MRRSLLTLLLAVVGPTVASAQDSFVLFGNAQFSAGRYGGDRAVSTAYLSVGTLGNRGRWRWWASLPFVFQDAATVRTVGAGMVPVGGSPHGTMSGTAGGMMGGGTSNTAGMDRGGSGMIGHAGVGDPILRLDVSPWAAPGAPQSGTIYAAVKAPVASAAEGFGTGRWDEGIGATYSRHAAAFSVLLDGAYWHVGRATTDPFRDVASGSLTLTRPLASAGQHVYASALATTPFARGWQAPVQLAIGWSRVGADRRVLAVTAGAGLTATAPALTMSASWQWSVR